MHPLNWPLLSTGVHLNCNAGTRAERSQEQFVRVEAQVIAAGRNWFVRLEHVRADRYILNESHRSGVYTHISRHISSQRLPVCASQKPIARQVPTGCIRCRFVFLELGRESEKGFDDILVQDRIEVATIYRATAAIF